MRCYGFEPLLHLYFSTFQIKLYEAVKPWQLENTELKTRSKNTSDELRRCQSELDKYKEVGDSNRRLLHSTHVLMKEYLIIWSTKLGKTTILTVLHIFRKNSSFQSIHTKIKIKFINSITFHGKIWLNLSIKKVLHRVKISPHKTNVLNHCH